MEGGSWKGIPRGACVCVGKGGHRRSSGMAPGGDGGDGGDERQWGVRAQEKKDGTADDRWPPKV